MKEYLIFIRTDQGYDLFLPSLCGKNN